jgi:glycosyltransferase A (GT-A) superfamily protein (DUF2064 family)
MAHEIQQSIAEVARAIEHLNRAFEQYTEDLRKEGDTQELQQWIKATHAMRDSGNIYLTWAKHYARTVGAGTDEGSELDEFLDEGAL